MKLMRKNVVNICLSVDMPWFSCICGCVFVCPSVHALEGKRLELSASNLVAVPYMAVTQH